MYFINYRQELNQMKSNQVASQRYIDELQTGSKHAAQNLEARYQAEVDAHQRDVVALQGQIQYHAARAQSLQATLDTMQVNPVQVNIYFFLIPKSHKNTANDINRFFSLSKSV
jgi:uncharacterized protein (DUF3084 family)